MKIFITILLLFFGQLAFGCLSAQQTRIFPIGKCDKGLILLETKLFRREKSGTLASKMIPAWFGKSHLNIYDDQQNLVHTQVLDSNLNIIGETYIEDFKPLLELAERIVVKKFSTDFVPAIFQNTHFADYHSITEGAELISDTIALKGMIKLDNSNLIDLNLFNSQNTAVQCYIETYDRWEYEDNREKKLAIINQLRIGSTRTFNIGDQTLCIIHLGSGQKLGYADPTRKREIPNVEIQGQLYDEPVLHHGQGFDFIIHEN